MIEIKTVLSSINLEELHSNEYYYHFYWNQKEYFVIRNNQYFLLDIDKFRFITPLELFTEFFVNDESLRSDLQNKKSEFLGLDILKDFSFEKSFGQILKITKLENAKNIESVSQNDIEYFSRLELLSKKFFITKYGFSMFSTSSETIPNGLVCFNHLNTRTFGKSEIIINRIGVIPSNSYNEFEKYLILFSPYTIKDCYEVGKSHFKDSLYIISNSDEIRNFKIPSNFEIHLRPTTNELICYLTFIEKYLQSNKIKARLTIINDIITFESICSNYAILRKDWLELFHTQLLLLTGIEMRDQYQISCKKKNVVPGTDIFEIKFKKTPDLLVVFVQYFVQSFYEKIVPIKKMTFIHYDKDFPEIIKENVSVEDIDFEDNFTPITKEDDYHFEEN